MKIETMRFKVLLFTQTICVTTWVTHTIAPCLDRFGYNNKKHMAAKFTVKVVNMVTSTQKLCGSMLCLYCFDFMAWNEYHVVLHKKSFVII